MSRSALNVSQEEAQQEVMQVLLARDDLALYAEYISDGWYRAHAMHHLIAYELQQVLLYLETDGEEGTQFLLILTPPQHGKSEMVSRMFPSFALGKLPDLRVIEVSYGADLATDSSRKVRDIIRSDRYKAVFGDLSPSEAPVILSSDSRSVSAWDLAGPHRGGMIAAGVGGAVPGRAKGLGIADDLIKGHKEAQSQQVRDDAWDFYTSALRVRMVAGVMVMTHWHPDDPAGRIIKNMIQKPNGDKWKVLMLPGIIEEGMFATSKEDQIEKMEGGVYLPMRDPLGRAGGEVLCPAMLNKTEMLKIREVSEYYFTALYQQMPYDKEGQRYKREWFKTVSKLPEGVTIKLIVRYWDKANSTKGDHTAGALMAYCSDGFFYFLDMKRKQCTSYERDQMMKKAADEDHEKYGKVKTFHQQDPGSAGKDSAEATNRVLMGFPAFFETVTGDKETRSEPMESAFQGGLIFLMQGAWNKAFIDECVAFPRGQYDDQVDAGSSSYNKLLELIGKKRESRIL